jgi:hypothetical protein
LLARPHRELGVEPARNAQQELAVALGQGHAGVDIDERRKIGMRKPVAQDQLGVEVVGVGGIS